MDTYNDNNFNRNNPHSIHAVEEPKEELTNEQLLELEAGEYQRKYMAEKRKNEAIKDYLEKTVPQSQSALATILLNTFFNGTAA